jgi:predicted dehydrogenase
MSYLSRRSFVRSAAAGVALAASGPVRGALGANERIRVGIIGSGGRAKSHVLRFKPHPALEYYHKDAEVVALCDPDPAQMDVVAAEVAGKPRMMKDFRSMLEMKDIDAVFVVTPEHWHAIPAIMAMQAGKHVYVEKPMAHTIEEGKAIVAAQAAAKVTCQVGTQQRSTPHWQHVVERIQAGELGRVTNVNVWNVWQTNEMGGDLGSPADCDPPPGVDYDLWLGPAPRRPFNPARFHTWAKPDGTRSIVSGFYFFWDYSSGMMAAWGVHLFDVVQWALGTGLKSVSASGGIYVLKDARETPDTAQAVFDYGDFVMSYQMRHANGWQPFGNMVGGDMDHGIEFVGTEGVMHCNRRGFQIYKAADRKDRKPYYSEKCRGDDTLQHHTDFFKAIREGRLGHAPPEQGHRAAMPGYLANISYRLGRSVRWDAAAQTVPDDSQAARMLGKEYRAPWHL